MLTSIVVASRAYTVSSRSTPSRGQRRKDRRRRGDAQCESELERDPHKHASSDARWRLPAWIARRVPECRDGKACQQQLAGMPQCPADFPDASAAQTPYRAIDPSKRIGAASDRHRNARRTLEKRHAEGTPSAGRKLCDLDSLFIVR